MRFSVIVPVYNVENYIEQCLDSILNQTYQNFEVILVDDGSTDRSAKLCDEYGIRHYQKIKVLHKKNQGVLAARVDGICNANGQFCVFVDSDDFVEPNLLEVVDSYLNRDLEVDILLYSFVYYRNGKKDNRFKAVAGDGYIWTEDSKREIYEKISCGSEITSIWSKAIRTSVLKEDPTNYALYYGKNMAEDLLQSLFPLTKARKIMYTDKTLYNYRINEESLSRSFRAETIDKKNSIYVYEKVLEYLKIWKLDNKEMRDKVDAKWFNDAIYIITQSYEMSSDKDSKNAVLNYDWSKLIPEKVYDENNRFENNIYKKLYSMWIKKDYRSIHRYFLKKKGYQKIRELKRKLLK